MYTSPAVPCQQEMGCCHCLHPSWYFQYQDTATVQTSFGQTEQKILSLFYQLEIRVGKDGHGFCSLL